MDFTLATAVHRSPSGANAHVSPEGDTVTAVLHAPAVPVRAISAGRVHIPGGKATGPQCHHVAEATLAVISGYAAVLSGNNMTPALPAPGDMIYIPPGMPYTVVNLSMNASVLLLAFRTDPGFTTDVHRASEMDSVASARIAQLRVDYHQRLMHQRTGRIRRSR